MIHSTKRVVVRLTAPQFVLIFVGTLCLAFMLGCVARPFILKGRGEMSKPRQQQQQQRNYALLCQLNYTRPEDLNQHLKSRRRRRRETLVRDDDVTHNDETSSATISWEALVHPAMMTHWEPKMVAVVASSCENSTGILREVIKHNSVQRILVIDGEKDYLCMCNKSNVEDERIVCNTKTASITEKVDIILYDSVHHDSLHYSAFENLQKDGIVAWMLNKKEQLEIMNLIRHLESIGFESLHYFKEPHAKRSTAVLMAFKDYELRANWFATESEREIQSRWRNNIDNSLYVDAATQVSYQLPHKKYETMYCHCRAAQQQQDDDDDSSECQTLRGYDPSVPILSTQDVLVQQSAAGQGAGRGVFAKRDISQGTLLTVDETVEPVRFPPFVYELMLSMAAMRYKAIGALIRYASGYGFESQLRGMTEVLVESGPTTFVNHGCDGTYSVTLTGLGLDEVTADPNEMPSPRSRKHSPVLERHLFQKQLSSFFLRSVKEGDEVLSNYLDYTADDYYWKSTVLELRALCAGQIIGEVTQYEEMKDEL